MAEGARTQAGAGRKAALICSLVVGALMFAAWREVERSIVREAAVVAAGAGARPQVAEVDRALEAMSLVTVILESKVTSAVKDESWRGDVDATVTVPVRLFFGTELDHARVDIIEHSPLTRTYVVRVPAPKRLATEIVTDQEQSRVDLGWLRFRTRAGEFYLGEARRKLSEAASAMVIDDAQAERVRDETRARVERLVRLVLGAGEGGRARVDVRFEDAAEAVSNAAGGVP